MPALHLLSIFLIAVSSNLDNTGVGTAYGIRKINIPITSNLIIAVVTSTGTLLSILLGEAVYLFLSEQMTALLGGGIIILAGIWVIFQEKFLQRERAPKEEKELVAETGLARFGFRQLVQLLNNPILADSNFDGEIDLRESIPLAFGLTINNIPNGVAAGMLGLSLPILLSVNFPISLITIWLGIYLGYLGIRWVGKYAGLLAGLLLIFVGLYEIFF
jgi:putative sporulation protein YtaF